MAPVDYVVRALKLHPKAYALTAAVGVAVGVGVWLATRKTRSPGGAYSVTFGEPVLYDNNGLPRIERGGVGGRVASGPVRVGDLLVPRKWA